MKEPNREPDFKTEVNRYYFEEMIVINREHSHYSDKLCEINRELHSENGKVHYINAIQRAYTKWKTDKEINNILLGSE